MFERDTAGEKSPDRQRSVDSTTDRVLLTDGGTAVPEDEESDDPPLHPVETWHDLTAFQRDLLRAVAVLDTPKGLTVRDHLSIFYSDEVRHPRLYGNLDQLVDAGLVDKGQRDGRSNYYELTERGLAVLHERDELLKGDGVA